MKWASEAYPVNVFWPTATAQVSVRAGRGRPLVGTIRAHDGFRSNGIRLRMEVPSVKRLLMASRQGAIQSAVGGRAGLRF